MRRPIIASLLLTALLALAGPIPAVSKPPPKSLSFYDAQPGDLQRPAGTLLRYEPLKLPSLYRAKAWRVVYVTHDYANRPILASGTVVLSGYAPKRTGDRAIVAWAHPTVGIARRCAPSLRQSPIGSIDGFDAMISRGMIITSTDYPGLGTVGPTGYLVGKGQAYAVLDSVRAARQIPEVGGSPKFGLWGFSQGGHAALFAANLAASYAPEMKLMGVAATAPPTDLPRLFRATANTMGGRVLTALTVGSWSRKYAVPLNTIADPQAISDIYGLNQYCMDDMDGLMKLYKAQIPLKHRFLNADPSAIAPWSQLMIDNSVRGLPAAVPAFIAQGQQDDIVLPAVTSQYFRQICREGNVVKFVAIPAAGHGGSVKASSKDAVAWLADRINGKPAPSSCR